MNLANCPNDLQIRPTESFIRPTESFICSNDSFIRSNDLLIRPNESFIVRTTLLFVRRFTDSSERRKFFFIWPLYAAANMV